MLNFIKKTIKLIRKIIGWGAIIYFVMILIGVIWFNISPPKEEVVLSIVVSDENKTKSTPSLAFRSLIFRISRKIDILIASHEILVAKYDVNISRLSEEYIDLDDNKLTYEMVFFEGELNNTIQSFHRVWIVQYIMELNKTKILLHDENSSFPIVIKKYSNQKWSDIEIKVWDNRTKYWKYRENIGVYGVSLICIRNNRKLFKTILNNSMI